MSIVTSIRVLVSLATLLPPHPLDSVLGNTQIGAEIVRNKILESDAFRRVIERAITNASREDYELGGTYAKRVRLSIGKQLCPNPHRQEVIIDQRPHPLDAVIGKIERTDELVRVFATSPEFLQVVRLAADNSDQWSTSTRRITFGQSVRIHIGEQLYRPADAQNTKSTRRP